MNDIFERHRDRRISEIRERIRNSRLKKKMKITTYTKHIER